MSKPPKSSEVLTIVKTNKLWIAFKVERTISLSSICIELDMNKIDIIAYRNMTGPQEERKWRTPEGTLLGRDASKFNSPTNRVESGLSAGIASLFYDRALRRIEVQRKELKHKPLSEVLKPRSGSEAPSDRGNAPSDNSTTLAVTKKGGASAATTAIVEITLRGTPSEIFEAMREILAGAVLGK